MHQSSVTVFVVDAFTDELFSGNPAAVCCLEKVSK
jgi:predicted PhzF superfamily epimerase YddE/YHI9